MKELAALREEIRPWLELSSRAEDAAVLFELADEADDPAALAEAEAEARAVAQRLEELELRLVLSGPYDKGNALLAVHAGSGGTEAQDWAAMMLRSKLLEMELEKREAEQAALRGEHVDASWGTQIRHYVLHPYKMVKDERTGLETSDANAVLDGDLDDFMRGYLTWAVGRDGKS